MAKSTVKRKTSYITRCYNSTKGKYKHIDITLVIFFFTIFQWRGGEKGKFSYLQLFIHIMEILNQNIKSYRRGLMMKKSTKLIIVVLLIIVGFMMHFSSQSIENSTAMYINYTGKVIFAILIGIMIYDAFRKEK